MPPRSMPGRRLKGARIFSRSMILFRKPVSTFRASCSGRAARAPAVGHPTGNYLRRNAAMRAAQSPMAASRGCRAARESSEIYLRLLEVSATCRPGPRVCTASLRAAVCAGSAPAVADRFVVADDLGDDEIEEFLG